MKKNLLPLLSYLCPAGDGVFTVQTGKTKKASLQKKLYGEGDANVIEAWRKSLQSSPFNEKPLILGVPSDSGGGILRGANWGPLLVREKIYEAISPKQVLDLGDVRVIPQLLHDKYLNGATLTSCREALYGEDDNVAPVSPLSITEKVLQLIYSEWPGASIFTLGGDHSVSYPCVKAFIEVSQRQKRKVGLLHFDAHTDLLERRLGIDLCFGTWVTPILKLLHAPQDCIQVGIRASGRSKSHWEATLGVKQFWAEEIKVAGEKTIAAKCVAHFKAQRIEGLYVTVDIDAIDAQYASATGTPEPNGLTPSELAHMIAFISESIPILGADLMEVAPFICHGSFPRAAQDQTLSVAGDLSLLLLDKLGKIR